MGPLPWLVTSPQTMPRCSPRGSCLSACSRSMYSDYQAGQWASCWPQSASRARADAGGRRGAGGRADGGRSAIAGLAAGQVTKKFGGSDAAGDVLRRAPAKPDTRAELRQAQARSQTARQAAQVAASTAEQARAAVATAEAALTRYASVDDRIARHRAAALRDGSPAGLPADVVAARRAGRVPA